jgi:hypothetical protein
MIGIIRSKNRLTYEESRLLCVDFFADCDCRRRTGIHRVGWGARLAGQDMLSVVSGAFHHFVGATKEALTTAKILLRGKAVVGVLFLFGPMEATD